MKYKSSFLVLVVLCLSSCTPKADNRGTNDSQQASEVKERVAAMYDDVFGHYNRGEFGDELYEKYFSQSLKTLWEALPDDEVVIEVDPWTWGQDFDTLSYSDINVEMLADDSACVAVTLSLWKDVVPYSVILDLVREAGTDGDNWYVSDFRYDDQGESPSMADDIRKYLEESK